MKWFPSKSSRSAVSASMMYACVPQGVVLGAACTISSSNFVPYIADTQALVDMIRSKAFSHKTLSQITLIFITGSRMPG